MKKTVTLNAIEVGNYLNRFYAAIEKRGQIAIENSTHYLEVESDRVVGGVSPIRIVNGADERAPIVYACPAWFEFQAFNQIMAITEDFRYHRETEAKLAMIGLSGYISILVKFSGIDEHTNIPLVLSFDIKKDVEAFLKRVSSIEHVSYIPEKPATLSVKIGHAEYTSGF